MVRTSSNRKGVGIGLLIMFVIIIGVGIGTMFMIKALTNLNIVHYLSRDTTASTSLLIESIVNSPSCLLASSADSEGNFYYQRNVINWSKVDTAVNSVGFGCMVKPPYVWKLKVADKDIGDVKEVEMPCTNVVSCYDMDNDMYPPMVMEKDVVIRRGDEYHDGNVTLYVASMNFEVNLERSGKKYGLDRYTLTIANAGSAITKFEYHVYVKHKNLIDPIVDTSRFKFIIIPEDISGGMVVGLTTKPQESGGVMFTIDGSSLEGNSGELVPLGINQRFNEFKARMSGGAVIGLMVDKIDEKLPSSYTEKFLFIGNPGPASAMSEYRIVVEVWPEDFEGYYTKKKEVEP